MDTAEIFLKKCVLLDIETGKDNRVFHIGAVCGQKTFEKKGEFDINPALRDLDTFCSDADYIVGHNIISHDLPILAGGNPKLKFLLKPVVDTLFLSPLAFPKNPYHRLIKDYKLVKSSINNPIAGSHERSGRQPETKNQQRCRGRHIRNAHTN